MEQWPCQEPEPWKACRTTASHCYRRKESGHAVYCMRQSCECLLTATCGGQCQRARLPHRLSKLRYGTPPATTKYQNLPFPVEIISHAVWLYFGFCLSFRDVEELLLERGVVVTYEAIRKWCRKFGQSYANQLRHRRPRPSDKWQIVADG